jgi:hypothetical protein
MHTVARGHAKEIEDCEIEGSALDWLGPGDLHYATKI